MTVRDRVAQKATSVTALCLLIMVIVLAAMAPADPTNWKDTFAQTLAALLGYYIGRQRTPAVQDGHQK